MAQFNWTNQLLEGLNQEIEEGTLDDVNHFIDTECKGYLPSSYPTKIILQTCCRTKKFDVLDALLGRGLKVHDFSLEDLFKDSNGNNKAIQFIDYDNEELSRLKQLVNKMLDARTWFFSCDVNYVIHLLEVYPEDIDFYSRLHSAGHIFDSEYDDRSYRCYSYAFANGRWKTAEFFAALGVSIDRPMRYSDGIEGGSIEKDWPLEAIDFVIAHDLNVDRFELDVPVETIAYAIRRGMTLRPRYYDSIWKAVVDRDMIELGEALNIEGVPFESVSDARPDSPGTLDWAARVGLRIDSVDEDCSKEVLLKAAELKIPPSNGGYLSKKMDSDVVKAFLDAGITFQLTSIKDATSYINNKGIAVIPDGVRRIETRAFQGSDNKRLCEVKGLQLPETLETIESEAFLVHDSERHIICGIIEQNATVRLPKSVKTIGANAFDGVYELEFYDNLDGTCIDAMNGYSGYRGCEYAVRSASCGSLKFKVWRPDYKSITSRWIEAFAGAWAPDCSFDFSILDKMYPDLYTAEAKLHIAINRLTWPIDLDEKTAKKYQRYVSQNLDTVMDILCSLDDPNRLNAVLSFAMLGSEQIERFKVLAKKKKAKGIRKALEDEALLQACNNDVQEKPKEKKLTVAQLITVVCDALDEGDDSKIEMLRQVAAKVPMADCVELLERAAANCTGEAIDALYELFAPFECASSALLVALFSGNVSTAKALVKHGADLDGNLIYIDEKRTPKSKREAREKRYSHGFMTGAHTSGHIIAHSLRDALTIDQGELVSRTKMGKDVWRRPAKVVVNKTSNENAAATLIAISKEEGFKKAIATRLLWNFISFDGREHHARFDEKNARKVLEAKIIDEGELKSLPWDKAIDSGSGWYGPGVANMFRLVRDYASTERFARCWVPRFAKPVEKKGYVYIDVILLFVDVLDSDNCSNQLDVLRALTEVGELDALKKLASKPGWLTKQRIKILVDIAGEKGQIEIQAWLLEQAGQNDGKSRAISLQL